MFTLDRRKIEQLVKDLPEFQRKVLLKVCEIPLGEVRSYKWVAEQIGEPKKVRQVGWALSKNPYPFFIPCHRVIRSDGSLGGYTFGVELKRYLLDLEKRVKSVIMMKKERKL